MYDFVSVSEYKILFLSHRHCHYAGMIEKKEIRCLMWIAHHFFLAMRLQCKRKRQNWPKNWYVVQYLICCFVTVVYSQNICSYGACQRYLSLLGEDKPEVAHSCASICLLQFF